MNTASDYRTNAHLPSLGEIGDDLLVVTPFRRLRTLAMPFIAMGCYALFAWMNVWPLAVVSVMMLSFVTYGSTSHDLVHRTLHLPHRRNDFLLSLIEMLSLRSGTAYRLSHMNHHAHLLTADDIEGETAHGTLIRSLFAGVFLQPRLWLWAWRKHPENRSCLLFEAVGILVLITTAIVAIPWTIAPLIYVVLVVGGSWFFPLITVYIPHDSSAPTQLTQTRLFRNRLVQWIAFEHLYHLEHHLYPAVPHHHWKKLANRLDPHFQRIGLRPYDQRIKK